MKVIQTINSIDKSDGGPSFYLQLLANEMSQTIDITLATQKSPAQIELNSSVQTYFGTKNGFGPLSYSKDLYSFFSSCEADVLHGHGLWQYPVHVMSKVARQRNIPYVISTHGMLESWSMSQGKFKKQVALKLFQKEDLRKADVIHATAEMEAENLRKLGYNQPIAVIPNGIDLTEIQLTNTGIEDQLATKRQLLFLSRIHPKKGLELFLHAWAKLDHSLRINWQVKIAGNGNADYINELNQIIKRLGVQEEIAIVGPVYGKDKNQLFQEADLFILPTHSENFGIVIAEALAYQTPVITTKMAPWKDLEQFHCGWWVNNDESAIEAALNEALIKSRKELKEMGKSARDLVETKYDIVTVSKSMSRLYEWMIGRVTKPDFILN